MLKKVFWAFVIVALIVAIWSNFKAQIISTAQILIHQNPSLQEVNGRVNILLLGIGGGTHSGPDLTDTMILASINKANNSINLISIPRDLWLASLGQGNGGKINEAYADGEVDNQHKGLTLASSAVENVTGQKIPYAFRIDFGGFVKAIDLIGGIDVQVQETLDDYHYPIDGQEDNTCAHTDNEIATFNATNPSEQQTWDFFPCRYKHLHVDKGLQHMDGQTALEFSRSRHGVGNEGTDFARSRRQQLVIESIRNKIFSLGIILNPSKIMGLYEIVKDSIDTNIPQSDFTSFIVLAQQMKTAKIQTFVIDEGDLSQNRAGLLIDTMKQTAFGNLFILEPRVGDQNFSEIHMLVTCEFTKGNCNVPLVPIIPTKTPNL